MTAATWAVAATLLLGGCEWILDHSLKPESEDSEALCSDGWDNDFNGLTDCQDWGCLNQPRCCTLQDVVLSDSFDGPSCSDLACQSQSCTTLQCGPDSGLWHTWPCPYPVVCDGALRPRKSFPQCYAAGVLSHASVPIGPGLALGVELDGAPERQGYLEAAFTVLDERSLPGYSDPCGGLQTVGGFVALRYIWTQDGTRLVALSQDVEIGRSDVLPTDHSHLAEIAVMDDRRVEFRVDGAQFATAPPLPETPQQARVALTGISETAAFASVQLRAGARCIDPHAWSLTGSDLASSEALTIDPGSSSWDSDDVHSPSVRSFGDSIELYYTGCKLSPGSQGVCTEMSSAIGRATATGTGVFARSSDPVLTYTNSQVPFAGVADLSIEVTPSAAGFLAASTQVLPLDVEDTIAVGDQEVLTTGSSILGEVIGGIAAVQHPDGRTFLWFSTTTPDSLWSIGVAISTDGRNFAKNSSPVLQPGGPNDFDSQGVLNPEVIYDDDRGLFVMWYLGRDFYGNVAIGQAASSDGVHWSKAPQNPVIDRALGFGSLGRPSVIWQSDGHVRMFVDGTPPGDFRRRIYSLENNGTRASQ